MPPPLDEEDDEDEDDLGDDDDFDDPELPLNKAKSTAMMITAETVMTTTMSVRRIAFGKSYSS